MRYFFFLAGVHGVNVTLSGLLSNLIQSHSDMRRCVIADFTLLVASGGNESIIQQDLDGRPQRICTARRLHALTNTSPRDGLRFSRAMWFQLSSREQPCGLRSHDLCSALGQPSLNLYSLGRSDKGGGVAVGCILRRGQKALMSARDRFAVLCNDTCVCMGSSWTRASVSLTPVLSKQSFVPSRVFQPTLWCCWHTRAFFNDMPRSHRCYWTAWSPVYSEPGEGGGGITHRWGRAKQRAERHLGRARKVVC